MAQPDQPRAPPRKVLQDPIVAAVEPALKTGAACGAAGFVFGGASGIVRGLPPGVAGSAAAIQWAVLSTTFSVTRTSILQAWTTEQKQPNPRDLTNASAIAGGVSGGWYALIGRRRLSAVPGVIFLSILGATGQHMYNKWTAPKEPRTGDNFWKRMGDKSWIPFKVLTNEEYSAMLQEKMLKLDVEIAVTDDKIAALRQHAEEAKKKPKTP